MGIFLQLMLLFSVCGLSSSVPHQFHVVKEEKTWAAAQHHCRENFTDLATIDNMAEMEEIRREMQDAGVGEGWIGLKNGDSPKWQWSLADGEFYRENETEFRNWDTDAGQPDGRSGADCLCMIRGGKWHDCECTSMYYFICYNELLDSTDPYVLVEHGRTWREAQTYCREKHTDLASVRNQAENNKIAGLYTGGDYVWIGLFRDAWEWSDGSSSSFRHWAPGEPNYGGTQSCAQITTSGMWIDESCHAGTYFIYEALPAATVEVVSPPPPFYSGDKVTLKCSITHYTDWHQYVWLKDNSSVPGKTNQTINITLPEDAGRYQCSGKRNNRPMASSVSSSVNITNKARVKRTQMVRVEMEASDDVNMEDPDVQKAFLQQIRDRLKAKGFKGDVKLSWMKQPDGKVFHQKNDKEKKRDEF